MDLESLLLSLLNSVRTTDGSRDLPGLLAPLLSGLGPVGGSVRDAVSGAGNSASSGGVLGGLTRASGLGAAIPLLGLLGLTGRDREEAPAERVRFELPDANRVELGFEASTGALGRIDYGDRQTLRTPSTAAPQINIHVSAMDAKSFADRSGEIADAVRSAMLQSHALNDTFVED